MLSVWPLIFRKNIFRNAAQFISLKVPKGKSFVAYLLIFVWSPPGMANAELHTEP